MQYRKLGRTDIEISTVAMGCWAIVGDFTWGEQDEADALAAIDAAFDAGINFFDTAPAYGDGYSEQLLGRALRGRRDRAVLATKVSRGDLRPDDVTRSVHDSLRRLDTDRIDLIEIHWPDWDVPLDETLSALAELKGEGKVRAIGVSNFGTVDLTGALRLERIETNQLCYSLLARAIEYDVQPLCVEQEVSILCYSPLAQGLLTGKFHTPDDVPDTRARTRHFSRRRPHTRHEEDGCETEVFDAVASIRHLAGRPMAELALAWALHQDGVTSVLAGARNPRQIEQNARAADLTLDDAVLLELNAASESVKQALGPHPDIWQNPESSRMR